MITPYTSCSYTMVVLMVSIPGSISERPDVLVTGVPVHSVLHA